MKEKYKNFFEVLDYWAPEYTISENGVTFNGSLNLSRTKITQLPDNLTVGDSIYLNTNRIKNITKRENCGDEKRTIFAAFVNGKICISAGCFLNDIDTFCKAVDQKYKDEAAEAYKNKAKECINEYMKNFHQ